MVQDRAGWQAGNDMPGKLQAPSFVIAALKITIFAEPPPLAEGVKGYCGVVGLENGASIAPFVAPGRGATVADGWATGEPPLNSGASLPPTKFPPGYASRLSPNLDKAGQVCKKGN